MSSELAEREAQGGLPALTFSRDQLDLIKRTVAKGATDDELALFLYTAKATGLNPLLRQIHAVKRWDSSLEREVMAIQVGIDGLRLMAERSGNYAPGRETTFVYDGQKIVSATAYVKKFVNGEWHEVAATAFYSEYVGKKKGGDPTSMWATKGHIMLSKCAEAVALRKAFPAETAGVHTEDELGQADNPKDVTPAPKGPQEAPKLASETHEAQSNAVTFVPESVSVKSGEKNGKPWKKYGIKHGNDWYGTFDETMGEIATDAKEKGRAITLTYKVDGKFLTVTSLDYAANN